MRKVCLDLTKTSSVIIFSKQHIEKRGHCGKTLQNDKGNNSEEQFANTTDN